MPPAPAVVAPNAWPPRTPAPITTAEVTGQWSLPGRIGVEQRRAAQLGDRAEVGLSIVALSGRDPALALETVVDGAGHCSGSVLRPSSVRMSHIVDRRSGARRAKAFPPGTIQDATSIRSQ